MFTFQSLNFVSTRRLLLVDWKFMIYKETKRLAAWRRDCFSQGGLFCGNHACLSTIPIYHMSVYQFKKQSYRKWIHSGGDFCGKVFLIRWDILFGSLKMGIER
uniref:Uncharacterized protein n=1 Tax=Arundo donax TaxID=35708 RepID=A0A0A9C1B3_ARUDO